MDADASPATGTMPARVAIALGLIAWFAMPFAILGRLLGAWPPLSALMIGFGLLLIAALASLVTALVGLWLGRRREPGSKTFRHSLLASIAALLILVFPAYWIAKALSVPPIHDITTDTADPPAFRAVLAERAAEHANPVTYAPRDAALQKAAYPDIVPLVVASAPAQTFIKALAVAKIMGWKIDAVDADAGHIEATDATRWIGFRDDIAIRISAVDGGKTRIDVRSLSRQGRSDIGANAARIRAYLGRLHQQLGLT